MNDRQSLIDDRFDAMLDLAYRFDAIHTLQQCTTYDEGVLKKALCAKIDKTVEELIEYLKEVWIKFNYKTAYSVIDHPCKNGLFHTDQVPEYLAMGEFIITVDHETDMMCISYAHGNEGVNVFDIQISSKHVNTLGALANTCG